MFTGIVTDVGTVRSVHKGGSTKFVIETAFDIASIDIGASIACSGACLTVTEKGVDGPGKGWFAADASEETIRCTSLGDWREGTSVNLERSLKIGDEIGGHIVSGHVDGVGKVLSLENEGESIRYRFQAPMEIEKYIAAKGSIAIDGVSLTVNHVEGSEFDVNIIPHTQSETTFGDRKAGSDVNLEVDVLARYIARLSEG
jgi:riboflavin synthase